MFVCVSPKVPLVLCFCFCSYNIGAISEITFFLAPCYIFFGFVETKNCLALKRRYVITRDVRRAPSPSRSPPLRLGFRSPLGSPSPPRKLVSVSVSAPSPLHSLVGRRRHKNATFRSKRKIFCSKFYIFVTVFLLILSEMWST